MAYTSQGSHTGQLDFATDWQMAAQRDNVISITLRQVSLVITYAKSHAYNIDFLYVIWKVMFPALYKIV